MRTFIALDLPPDFADDAAALARRLSPPRGGRFLNPAPSPPPLPFPGAVAKAHLAAATAALEAACAGASPAPLRSDGLGKFGRAPDATLWLGIAAAPELEQLAARLRDELRARDVPFDAKPFKAHFTLARRARIPHVGLPHLAFPQNDEATDVTLYKSTLDRAGAVYKPLHTVCLGTIAAERV